MEFWDSLIQMSSALAVVLGLMILLMLVVRRILPGQTMLHGSGPLVHVLGTGYIAPRKTIAVVAVAGEILIVGATATHLVPLGRIREPERLERFFPRPSKESAEPDDHPSPAEIRQPNWLARVFKLFEDEGVWRVSASPPNGRDIQPRSSGWLARRFAFLGQNGRPNVRQPREPVPLKKRRTATAPRTSK